MNRKQLVELGVEEGLIEGILKIHADTLDGNYVPKSRFNEVNEENKTLKETVSERDTQIEELSKVDADKLQETITQLQEDNQSKEEEYQAELKKLKVKHAAERQIADFKAKDLTSVLAHIDLNDADLNDDGTVQGLKDKLEALSKEKDFLFDKEVEEPADPPKPKGAQPGKPKGSEPGGKLDPKDMTFEQFQEYLESQNK